MSIKIIFLTYSSFIIHHKSIEKSPKGAGPPTPHSTDTSQAKASPNGCNFRATLGVPSHFWVDCHNQTTAQPGNQATNWVSPIVAASLGLFATKSLCSIKLHNDLFQEKSSLSRCTKTENPVVGVFPFFCFFFFCFLLQLPHF